MFCTWKHIHFPFVFRHVLYWIYVCTLFCNQCDNAFNALLRYCTWFRLITIYSGACFKTASFFLFLFLMYSFKLSVLQLSTDFNPNGCISWPFTICAHYLHPHRFTWYGYLHRYIAFHIIKLKMIFPFFCYLFKFCVHLVCKTTFLVSFLFIWPFWFSLF